jgi:O-antigen/teichoic acid export membrane protein
MNRHQLKTSILWIIVENSVTVLGAFVLIACARIIGTHAFGLASIAFFVGTLAETLVATPFNDSLIQRRYLSVSVIDTAHTSMVSLGLIVSLSLVALGPVFAWIYHEPQLFALIAVQGTTCFLLGWRGAPEAIIVRKLRFKSLSLRNITAKTVSSLMYVGMALAGAGAWALTCSNVAFALIATCMIWAATTRKPKLRWRKSEALELFNFGFFNLMDAVLWTATPRLFGFLVGYFHGVSAAGVLNIAFRINDTLSGIIAAVTHRIAFPYFSRIAHEPQRLREAYGKGTRLTFMIAAPAFAGMALVGNQVIELILGSQWAAAAPALAVVSFFGLLNLARVLAQPAIKALGRPSLLLWLHGVGLGYIAIGCTVTAPFSLTAELWVWASFGIVSYLTAATLLRRASGLGLLEQIAPLALGSTGGFGMTVCVMLLRPHLATWPAFPTLVAEALTGAVVYLSILFVMEWRTVAPLASPYLRFLSNKDYRQ